MENMILIMVDECGDEVEVARYTIHEDDGEFTMDPDELDIWQERKIERATIEYPEARGFYFEDRRAWSKAIAKSIREDLFGWSSYDYNKEWEEE